MKIVLLHNPQAGMADHDARELVAALSKRGAQLSYCSSKADDFPDCLSQGDEPVIVAGGDGTVAKAVKHLSHRGRSLGILPLGSANNAATSLGFDRDDMLAGNWPESTRTATFHLGRVRGSGKDKNFLEGVGFGALAASIDAKTPPAKSAREKLLNARRLVADALSGIEPIAVEVTIDEQVVEGRWLMVEALTLSHSGPRLPLAQRARGLDGEFSVILLDQEKRLAMLEWLDQPHKADPPVRVMTGRTIGFRLQKGAPFRIDDEVETSDGTPIEVRIDQDPLSLLVPHEPEKHNDQGP